MKSRYLLRPLCILLALPLTAVPLSFAWGREGHMMINRLAAEGLPADMPAFLRTPEAINEIEYLGPEPDRWRSRAEPELNAEQAPDHFIDIELTDLINGPLPRNRYDYIAALYAAGITHPRQAADLRPERVGFQPYIVEEVWERLKSAMRDYRQLSAQHQDTKPVEAAILFYAGWLGHYVGDGSQPLHVTVNYNGWVGKDNPNGYTTEHTIHSQFETVYVAANIKAADVQPLVAPVHSIGDEWDDYLAYLRHSGTLVEKVYQLDKDHGFDGAGTPEAKQFTAERLAAGASMLRDLYVAAWTKSAEPVPEWHEHSENAPGSASPATAATLPAGVTIQKLPVSGVPLAAARPDPIVDQPFTGDAHRPGGSVKPPALAFAPPPQYTPEAKKAKLEGTVLVALVVDENGYPRNVHVVKPLGKGLDEQAILAVQRFRFHPALRDGAPVPVTINIEENFRLY